MSLLTSKHNNIESITLFVAIVIIVFGVLQIILFFKIWKTTNEVSQVKSMLSEYVSRKDVVDWKRRFCIMIAAGRKDEAKLLLFNNIVNSLSFKNVVISTNPEYRNNGINEINQRYSIYLKSLGLSVSDIDFDNPVYKEVIK